MVRRAFFVLLLASSGIAHAADKPVYAPVPDWVKPVPPIDTASLTAQSPVYLEYDNQQRLQDGQVWTYVETATRASTAQVLSQIGTVTLPWLPDKGDLIIHRAEIIRGTDHIDLLAAGDRFQVLHREAQLEQSALNGQLTATMAVEGLRVGDVLRVSFSITQKDPTLKGGVQSVASLVADPVRLQFGRIRLLWPNGSDIHWKAYSKGVDPVQSELKGYHELTLDLPLAKQPDMPGDAPVRFQNLPILEMTSFDGWPAISKLMAPLYQTDGLIAAGSPLAAEVAKIEAAESDPLKRTELALQLVQDKVRYLFKGMDGGNYVPQKPGDTWSLRYGDCKAKTLLLLALLHAMHIEAEPVLASSTLGDLVATRLPAPGAFDHVLVRATVGGDSLWLDGTQAGAQLADIHDTPAFENVLPLRMEGAGVLAIQMRPSARPDIKVALDLDEKAGINFPVPFKIAVTLKGGLAEALHAGAAQAGKEQLDKLASTLTSEYVDSGTIVSRALSFDAKAGTATLTASGISYPDWSKENDRLRTSLDHAVSSVNFDPDRARTAWRDIPVATQGPTFYDITTRIHLPDGGKGFTLDGDEALSQTLAGTQLKRTSSLEGGVLTVEDEMITTGAEIAPGDIAATRQKVAAAKSRLLRASAPADYPALWQQVDALKRAHAFDPILAVYKQGIADKPDERVSYTNRAWFYERIFDRKAAIADLDKAIEMGPDVATYLRRSALYAAIGDDDKAIVDALAARALDPGSDAALNRLAFLRADHGQSDDAMALVQERVDAGGKNKSNYLATKADLLARGGDKDAALSTIDSAIASSPGNPTLLNSRCWLKGTLNVALDTALKDCTKSIELSESPSAALDSRAMVYFRLNRMDDALADLNAALDIAPDLPASMYMRGVIRKKAGDAKQGDADLAAARLMAPQIDRTYKRYGITP